MNSSFYIVEKLIIFYTSIYIILIHTLDLILSYNLYYGVVLCLPRRV